jgi:hypothetical protein
MHEAIITRGDLPNRYQHMIMVRQNCVLLHDQCHHVARGDAEQAICIHHLVAWEGLPSIIKWLESMQEVMKSRTASDKLRRVLNEFTTMSNLQ